MYPELACSLSVSSLERINKTFSRAPPRRDTVNNHTQLGALPLLRAAKTVYPLNGVPHNRARKPVADKPLYQRGGRSPIDSKGNVHQATAVFLFKLVGYLLSTRGFHLAPAPVTLNNPYFCEDKPQIVVNLRSSSHR
jgi:hypothetical protein